MEQIHPSVLHVQKIQKILSSSYLQDIVEKNEMKMKISCCWMMFRNWTSTMVTAVDFGLPGCHQVSTSIKKANKLEWR